MRSLYSAIVMLLTPLALARLWLRGRRAPAYRRRWRERLGFVTPVEGRPLWIHAVSVGEAQAAAPLVQALLKRHPELPLLVTTTTPTGAERVAALFGERVEHRYMPFDTPGAVRRFLDRTAPRLLVTMETEIWPNLFHHCRRRGIDVVVANARLSERSARGYRRVAALTRRTLEDVALIAAQHRADGDRFIALGADPERVVVTGSIKFDIQIPASVREQGAHLRSEMLGAGRSVWIAASTHEGEEALLLDAFARIRAARSDALLLLVPRHPERFDGVAALCREHGFEVVRRSEGRPCDERTDIFLGDTMGELIAFYAASDVAYIGGSLVPVGGHNLLEAAALGLPVVYGPHMFNFEAIQRLFLEQGASRQVANVDELAAVVTRLLDDPADRAEVGERALALVEGNRGAMERLLERIEARLSGPGA